MMNNAQRHSNVVSTDVSSNRRQRKSLYCVFCKKEKPLEAFSDRQIGRAFYNNKPNMIIFCLKCSPSQQTKLTCMVCLKTKTLNGFSKRQRRSADKAMCTICIKKREEEDIWATDPDTTTDADSSATDEK